MKILLILTLVLIVSCRSEKKDPTVLVYSNKVNYEALILVDHQKKFEGIKTKTVVGGIQAAEALLTGSAHVGAMGESPAVVLLSRNKSFKIIARFGGGEKTHRLISQNEIQSPQDLVGKKVGVQFGSSTHGALILWLAHQKIKADQVQIIPLHPRDMPEAMKSKKLDAMAGSEPWPTNVEKRCKDQVKELGDFSGLGHHYPMLLLAKKSTLESRAEDVKAIIAAMQKATLDINSDISGSAKILSQYTGLDEASQEKCLRKLFREIGWNEQDFKSLNLSAEFLKKAHKIDNIPNFRKALDLSHL